MNLWKQIQFQLSKHTGFTRHKNCRWFATVGAVAGYLFAIVLGIVSWWERYSRHLTGIAIIWSIFVICVLTLKVLTCKRKSTSAHYVTVFIYVFSFFLCSWRPVAFFGFSFLMIDYWYLLILIGSVGGVVTYLLIRIHNNTLYILKPHSTEMQRFHWIIVAYVFGAITSTLILTTVECITVLRAMPNLQLPRMSEWFTLFLANFFLVSFIFLGSGIEGGKDNFSKRVLLGGVGGIASIYVGDKIVGFQGIYFFDTLSLWMEWAFGGRSSLFTPPEVILEAQIVSGAFLGMAIAIGVMLIPKGAWKASFFHQLILSSPLRLVGFAVGFIVLISSELIIGVSPLMSGISLCGAYIIGINIGRSIIHKQAGFFSPILAIPKKSKQVYATTLGMTNCFIRKLGNSFSRTKSLGDSTKKQ